MSSLIDHIILTRFNLPSLGSESLIRAKDGWLRDRIELFEKFCLPSVRAQTNRNFHWIIYLDPESPIWLKNRMNDLNVPEIFTLIYRSSVSEGERISDIKAVCGPFRRMLITTNLDNDDALATDFVERLQELPPDSSRNAVYFIDGVIRQGRRLYKNRDRSNAFCSVRESWESPVTCWADWHDRLGLVMPVTEIEGPPAWLQVVHSTNVSNRVRGIRVRSSAYICLFDELLKDIEDPSQLHLLQEAVWESPYRNIREFFRAIVKAAILQTMGKEGLEKIKTFLKSRTGPIANRP